MRNLFDLKTNSFGVLVCEYYAHDDCKDFAVNDCRETANYVPSRDNVKQIDFRVTIH